MSDRWGYYYPPTSGKVVWAECVLKAPGCIPGRAGRNSDPTLPKEPLDPMTLDDLSARWGLGTSLTRLLDTLAQTGRNA